MEAAEEIKFLREQNKKVMEGMDALLDIADCKRRHLLRYEHAGGDRFGYEEATITCTQAPGYGNAKMRAKALWKELKPLLKAAKFAAVQARVCAPPVCS